MERVVTRTRRRVRQGEAVPATEKVLSRFEPHTAVIRRGQAWPPTEFGATRFVDEVAGGLGTGYALAAGNPDAAATFPASLAHHRAGVGRPPRRVAADRHDFSEDNERLATALGVRHVVLPKQGRPGRADRARRERERAPWFRRGCRFRAGSEGRISVLRRRFGLRRCRSHGPAGLERWVGWGILAHDLRVVSRALAARRAAAAPRVVGRSTSRPRRRD